MSAFTANDLYELFKAKGYDGLTRFYSTSFEFTDTIKAGLERVVQEFAGQASPGNFSLSCYPVWQKQGKPYVSSYISCSYNDEKFSIRLLDLSYQTGSYKGELYRQLLKEPKPEDIPDNRHLGDTLVNLSAPCSNVKQRTNKRYNL